MKSLVVVGTRPDIIKMAPIIREYEKRGNDYLILHTGQHYSSNMDSLFFKQLNLPQYKYNLNAGLESFRKQVGVMMQGIKKIYVKEKPDTIVVLGDTNTTLAASLAANQFRLNLAHIEAGLRSHDVRMLEETNRIIVDHISSYLLTPTETTKKNLEEEGLTNNVFVTGNTIVDSVKQNLKLIDGEILKKLNLDKQKFILVTSHRPENVDFKSKLQNIFSSLNLVHKEFNLPIIFSVHPRTKKMIDEFKINVSKNINLIDPVGYLEFLDLQSNAKLILTDSGGIQEESCVLNVPCVTLRENTERPETLQVESNVLTGTDPEKILEQSKIMINRAGGWENPYGDGTAAKKILDILEKSE
ncbi:MAG: UDP-N-acetylglucosamine 2-epimerase (non-hydrolyzing) [Nanoarchaeota archaeon]|nr:UDP-N-acetylglucosamine 2-epimerase (non-hydrolyzing) [Nanoarchaeota archaeon]